MNKSLNVFLSVLLCFVLCAGVLTSLYTTDDSASQHYQTEYTSSIPTGIDAPSVSFGVGANGDVLAVPMSSRPSRGSVRHLSSHHLVTSSPNSHITSSPNSLITYTSSSQTMKSFGGGSNAAGVSMSGGVVSTNNLTTSSPNSLLALSPNPPLTSSPNTLITSSPDDLFASSTGARGIGGRHNAPGAGFGNSWIEWLEEWYNGLGYTGGTFDDETNLWTVGVNNADLEAAYDAFLANWNYGLGDPPTLEQWYAWFLSNGGSHTANNGNIYNFTPVGDILPLLLFPLFYVFFLAVFCKFKRSETTISVNE